MMWTAVAGYDTASGWQTHRQQSRAGSTTYNTQESSSCLLGCGSKAAAACWQQHMADRQAVVQAAFPTGQQRLPDSDADK